MDLTSSSNASSHLFPSTTNASAPSVGLLHLPPTFLDAIIPGYSILAANLLAQFGIDLSFYVSLLALFFVATTALNVTISPVIDRIFRSLTSTVVVDEYDSIFNHVLDWLSSQKSLQDHRILRAHTGGQGDDEDEEDDPTFGSDIGNPDMIFNFNDFATRVGAKYEPHSSTGFFRHRGHIFRIARQAERVQSEWGDTVRDREKFIITVVWRSTSPIKALIEEARELSFTKRTSSTMIFRPTPKQQRGAGNEWQCVSTRPSRSLDTVVLDDKQKLQCVSDINEFLQAARWYSNRGIPYRRGYLFHGGPGVGKTSLSFALAGLFGLEIYCLSLSEITLTEEDLIMLFTALPQRCIVLLEDIDCAGVSRPEPAGKDKKDKKKSKKKSKSSRKEDPAPAPAKLTNAITISGLLNAIDGVATAEGRILIMTTNYPDKLDAALTRPGRIDLRVEFKLASKQQITELFLRMYCADDEEWNKQPTKISQIVNRSSAPKELFSSEEKASRREELGRLARSFADALPDEHFSPAEIQGFLLMHKKSPEQAVDSVALWRETELVRKGQKEEARAEKKTTETDAREDRAEAKAEVKEAPIKGLDTGKSEERTESKLEPAKKKKPKKEAEDTPRGSESESESDSGDDSDSTSGSSSDSD